MIRAALLRSSTRRRAWRLAIAPPILKPPFAAGALPLATRRVTAGYLTAAPTALRPALPFILLLRTAIATPSLLIGPLTTRMAAAHPRRSQLPRASTRHAGTIRRAYTSWLSRAAPGSVAKDTENAEYE